MECFRDEAYYDYSEDDPTIDWVGLRERDLIKLFGKYLGLDEISGDVDVEVLATEGLIVIRRRLKCNGNQRSSNSPS